LDSNEQKTLTLLELKEIIDRALKMPSYARDAEHTKVCVRLSDSSVGPSAKSLIRCAGFGIDWDKGYFILTPQIDIVRRTENQALWQRVRDFLFMLSGESRSYKGEERLTSLAKHVRKILNEFNMPVRKVGTFIPEDKPTEKEDTKEG